MTSTCAHVEAGHSDSVVSFEEEPADEDIPAIVHGENCKCREAYERFIAPEYMATQTLGTGTFGTVKLYQSLQGPPTRYAVKMVTGFWGGKKYAFTYNVCREVRMQKRAYVHGVAPKVFKSVAIDSRVKQGEFTCFAIWMQPVGLSHLTTFLDPDALKHRLTARGVHLLVRQLVFLLEGLRRAGVAHLDLSPGNIRVTVKELIHPDNIRLEDIKRLWTVDFGFSLPLDKEGIEKVHDTARSVNGGVMDVMPPERLVEYARESKGAYYEQLLRYMLARGLPAPPVGCTNLDKTDIYSAGVILHSALTGCPNLSPDMRTAKALLEPMYICFEPLEPVYYNACKSLVKRIEYENPALPRPPMFMPQLAELVRGMTDWDVTKRWSLEKIKSHPFVAKEFDLLGEAWTKVYPDKVVAER